jgi:hypothetical protein
VPIINALSDESHPCQHIDQWPRKTWESTTALGTKKIKACVRIKRAKTDMIKLQLINADIIFNTAIVTSRLFRNSFKVALYSDFVHPNQESLKVHISANTWWIFKIQDSFCSFLQNRVPFCLVIYGSWKNKGKIRFWHSTDEIVYLRIGGIYQKSETWFCSLCMVN